MEALAKCRQIVQNIPPEYQTQREKMEYLYDYVCDHVEYVAYESMADESYFYDAVCKGQTICDGYSNMLMLLFRLIGVECCEVMGNGEEGQAGHTWVAAKVDGEFYNFDPTFEDTNEMRSSGRKYFGFSDDLVSMKELEYEQMRPKCTNTSMDFACANMIVDSLTDWNEVKKIAALAEERMDAGEEATLIGVKSVVSSEDFDLFFDRYFTYGSSKIVLYSYDMGSGTLVEAVLLESVR